MGLTKTMNPTRFIYLSFEENCVYIDNFLWKGSTFHVLLYACVESPVPHLGEDEVLPKNLINRPKGEEVPMAIQPTPARSHLRIGKGLPRPAVRLKTPLDLPKPPEAVEDGRYGPRFGYVAGNGTEYLLSGVRPENSVLLALPLSTRRTADRKVYGLRRWLMQNVSALGVFFAFWWGMLCRRPKDVNAVKALLDACPPRWYPAHPMAEQIRHCVTGTGALVPLYDREAIFGKIDGLTPDEEVYLDEYNQPEAVDVTNRLFATAEAMYNHIMAQYAAGEREFRLASIACGSSRAMLDVAYLIRRELAQTQRELPSFEFHFVDKDSEALRSAEESAVFRGFGENIEMHAMSASDFFVLCEQGEWTFDIVEMVGLADYLKNVHRIRYYRGCWGILKLGGMFVVAEILHTRWAFSVKYRTGWPGLRRRFASGLHRRLVKAGFDRSQIALEVMPACGAHGVGAAHRTT